MRFLAPDILADAQGLSAAVSITGLVTGLLVWLFGWHWHRFWIVLSATLLGGVFGLYSSPAYGVQPLVGGLLLAVAAGTLALSLVRLVAFATAGLTTWLAVHALLPTWDEPVVCFLAGGLVGLLLFRLWTMALTSTAGTLLTGYCALLVAHRYAKMDAAAWAEKHTVLLNWVCGGAILLGIGLQFFADRRRQQKQKEQEEAAKAAEEEKKQRQKEDKERREQQQKARKLQGWVGWAYKSLRQAG